MILNIQDDILKLHSMGLLDKLLLDKSTGKHIMWATDAYSSLGSRYSRNEEITSELITGPNASVIKTRARKEMEQQSSRTRQRGEVSTPLWVCRKMCDYSDEMWDSKAGWQKYVDARVLEITCGEAPFLVSRYDAETGEAILVPDRIGLLDRKLRAVNENVQTEEEWLKWAFWAFWATYGYEFQGDNVLIARVNLLMTFEEYLLDRWKRKPTISEYGKLITVIVWNIWQMDGLQGTIPYGSAEEKFRQFNLFEFLGEMPEPDKENKQPRCRVYNWLGGGSVEYSALPIRGKRAMKFDFVIGNPPYQDETLGENKGYAPPIYHLFLDGTYKVADKVELIHPARFLFNAGSTPKAWNQKMLADPHLKVVRYEQDAKKIFCNTEIIGGIAITYYDKNRDFGCIGTFTAFRELNTIIHKVHQYPKFKPLSKSVVTSYAYRFTEDMHKDYPEVVAQLSKGHAYDLKSNVFERATQIFFDTRPNDNCNYIRIIGREGGKRTYKFIRSNYVNQVSNLFKYKIILSKADGASGTIGNPIPARIMGSPSIEPPGTGSTESFFSIGAFDTQDEAQAALKYIKTKFARTMLGVLKTTQDITPQKWEHVPLQDFTPTSDIDWTKSIPEIDQQLYKKYDLDETEIQFIETHVKEMT
ncbi:restriction endonuclease [Pseudoflavonifractor sp. 524-17]|uniref:Eco57I restriction-modification methylase domain-containing protein n=1 Tax=Pseudoflavonifractor sp. 524-17 TaxID=2304577 RepID=UPI00137A25F2|nr:Eco57I restriction-modification methylase domain-containing protein [Pseudoflavonifractor sp. 524-17]NCE63520.1 restriction endonuclease [Pseudoflavonifractor sp. 524-17]